MHNETINVWTHLIAFLMVLILLIMTMSVVSPHGVDRLDLDVVLASSKGSMPNRATASIGYPTPVAEFPLSGAAANTTPQSEDPMEVLQSILGEDKDRMLIELVSRMQTLMPNLQHLTQTLKEKAAAVQESLMTSLPVETATKISELSKESRISFFDYMQRIEGKLAKAKQALSDIVTPSEETSQKAQAASKKMAEEYEKLLALMGDFAQNFSPELLQLTSATELDVLTATRNVLSNFVHEWKSKLGMEPSVVSRPGLSVQVRVKDMIEGLHLGSGTPYLLGISEAMEELAQHEQGETERVGPVVPTNTFTRVDEDGEGKTLSTTIGYLAVDAHTRASQPGQVQLQLHSFLPRYPLAIFLLTAMACLMFSSCYHLLLAVSGKWARRFQALDYAGIVLLIAGSTHPIVYYSFFCQPVLKWSYIAVVWALGIMVFTIVVLPSYRHAKYRVLKVMCFISMAIGGTGPLMHFQLQLGQVHFITYWLLVMGACYLLGALIYVTQVPERWWPGMFDFVGHSHQLWHVSIFCAIIVHFLGLMHMYEWRMTRVCGPGLI
jgi:channel protein (hemolysin III family)